MLDHQAQVLTTAEADAFTCILEIPAPLMRSSPLFVKCSAFHYCFVLFVWVFFAPFVELIRKINTPISGGNASHKTMSNILYVEQH